MLKRTILAVVLLALIVLPSLTGCKSNPNQAVAVLETDYGKIVFEFYPDVAPKHTERIQQLVRSDFYNGTAFHRVEPNSLIQGGDPNTIRGDEKTWGLGQRDQPRIQSEFSKLRHVRGIVSAARVGSDVNSATSQFFICCSDHPEWDNQYSIFGRVIVGMNVVDIISQAPTVEGTTRPKDKIKINRAYLDLRSNYPATPVGK